MKMEKWIVGTKKGSSKVEIYVSVHDAQIEATTGWSEVIAVNKESARAKYRDLVKKLKSKEV